MIPEPFTLTASSLGVLATAFTATTVVAGTIYKTKHKWADCWVRLLALKLQIRQNEEKYKALRKLWTLDAHRKPEDYNYLFGSETMVQLELTRQTVDSCMSSVSASLRKYQIELPDGQALCSLETLRDWANKHQSRPTTAMRKLAMRAIFAIVTADELESMVVLLDKRIAALESLVQVRITSLPDFAPTLVEKKDSARFLEAILSLRDYSHEFRDWMNALHCVADEDGVACYVVPRFQDDECHFHRLIDGGDLAVTFSLRNPLDVTRMSKLRQINYPAGGLSLERLFADMQHSKSNVFASEVGETVAFEISLSLRDINTKVAQKSEPYQAEYRGIVKRRRVQAAIALLTWSNLLWASAWTAHICACSLKQSITTSGEVVFAMSPRNPVDSRTCSLCEAIGRLRRPDSVSTSEAGRRASLEDEVANLSLLFRVVVTLCEISLCEPVEIAVANEAITFCYKGQVNSKDMMLRDLRLRCEGRYSAVVKDLLRVVDDPLLPAAPFDVICTYLEQARCDLQLFYDKYFCGARRKDLEKRDWYRQSQAKINDMEMPKCELDGLVAQKADSDCMLKRKASVESQERRMKNLVMRDA